MADSLFTSTDTIVTPAKGSPYSPFTFFDGSDPFSKTYGTAIGWFFTAVGTVLFVYLIWAGIKYITAGGDPKKSGDAKASVINAFIGILIFISVFTLMSIGAGLGNSVKSIETEQATFAPTPTPKK